MGYPMISKGGALPRGLQAPPEPVKEIEPIDLMTLDEAIKHTVLTRLTYFHNNKSKTADSLGIAIKTLYNKLHSYGSAHDYRFIPIHKR